MNHKIFSLVLVLLLTTSAFSQNFLFKVIASKGKCTVQKKASGNWEPLNTGATLSAGDKLKLEANDYLGLLHVKGKSFELKGAGSYSVDELSKSASNMQTTMQKFAGFVLNESANKKKSDNMRTLGAVVRANPDAVEVFFPSFTTLTSNVLTAQWYAASNEKINYTFELLNNENRSLFIKETSDTVITVDLAPMNLIPNQNYKWLVYKSGQHNSLSDTLQFCILDKQKITSINDSVSLIKSAIDPNSAVDLLLLAGFYENNKLNIDAKNTYEKLLESVPGVGDYFNIYASFLLKYNMLRRAQFLLNKL